MQVPTSSQNCSSGHLSSTSWWYPQCMLTEQNQLGGRYHLQAFLCLLLLALQQGFDVHLDKCAGIRNAEFPQHLQETQNTAKHSKNHSMSPNLANILINVYSCPHFNILKEYHSHLKALISASIIYQLNYWGVNFNLSRLRQKYLSMDNS